VIGSEMPQSVGRDWIARHIPHHGSMCLIDEVTAWDGETIHCTTRTHTQAGNPLRADGRLGAACGVEYAAQAVAIHCAILQTQASRPATTAEAPPVQGYLAAVRDVDSRVDRLDAFPHALDIVASRYAALDRGAVYTFIIRHQSATLLTGRITLKAAAHATGAVGPST